MAVPSQIMEEQFREASYDDWLKVVMQSLSGKDLSTLDWKVDSTFHWSTIANELDQEYDISIPLNIDPQKLPMIRIAASSVESANAQAISYLNKGLGSIIFEYPHFSETQRREIISDIDTDLVDIYFIGQGSSKIKDYHLFNDIKTIEGDDIEAKITSIARLLYGPAISQKSRILILPLGHQSYINIGLARAILICQNQLKQDLGQDMGQIQVVASINTNDETDVATSLIHVTNQVVSGVMGGLRHIGISEIADWNERTRLQFNAIHLFGLESQFPFGEDSLQGSRFFSRLISHLANKIWSRIIELETEENE